MAIYDTTNSLNTNVYLKAKLSKNMVGDNYYIQNLQDKRNRDWEYRYNVVDIEQEATIQKRYDSCLPVYTPLEVVIHSVKDQKGQDLGTDWAELSFKNLKHQSFLGRRYRFALDFPDMSLMSEEDKYFNTSVWININESPIKPGASCIVRRCNSSIALVGSPSREYGNITEVRYEPVVLENDLKYMNLYYNQTLVVPQAEWYVTMQMNYFANAIKINDRLILGGVDLADKENNSVYKVKAVIKCNSTSTFQRNVDDGIDNIPYVILALDKDMVSGEDDFEKRIPAHAPLYYVPDIKPVNHFYIHITDEGGETVVGNIRMMLGETYKFNAALYINDMLLKNEKLTYKVTLPGIKEENWGNYFEFVQVDNNSFTIKNLKACNRGLLVINISCPNPEYPDDEDKVITNEFSIKLGGFY